MEFAAPRNWNGIDQALHWATEACPLVGLLTTFASLLTALLAYSEAGPGSPGTQAALFLSLPSRLDLQSQAVFWHSFLLLCTGLLLKIMLMERNRSLKNPLNSERPKHASLRPPTLMIDLLFGALMLFAFQMGDPHAKAVVPHEINLPTGKRSVPAKNPRKSSRWFRSSYQTIGFTKLRVAHS